MNRKPFRLSTLVILGLLSLLSFGHLPAQTPGYIPLWLANLSQGDSILFQCGTSLCVGTLDPGTGRLVVSSDSEVGILGRVTSPTGDYTGVWGQTDSAGNRTAGVFGVATASNGSTTGVWGRTVSPSSGATGVFGEAQAASGQTYGVYGRTSSADTNASGVLGEASAGATNGVWGLNSSAINNATGVFGFATASDGNTVGVWGRTASASSGSAGVFGEARGNGAGVWGRSATGLAGFFQGKVQVNGAMAAQVVQITGGSDLSEKFEVRDAQAAAQPGMVVAIDPANPGKLVVSSRAYDRRVAGILSGAGGVKPGMLMGQSGTLADGDHPVALTGRVYVWADASNGPIVPGDLLTTSNIPGHAMKVTSYNKAQGATIGKAMTGLAQGRGLVLTLVTLQ